MPNWQKHETHSHGVTYRDQNVWHERRFEGVMAPVHYETVPDSGQHDAKIDMQPVRVVNAAFDGWRVVENGWHYALGQPSGKADGWVGFGGRGGAHWFQSRLLRVGYMHWSTRAWKDLGGAPTYDRANLSQSSKSLTLGPDDEEFYHESDVTWEAIWTTPGSGRVDIHWRADGNGLKEEIVLNQEGRAWIAANRAPAMPLTETWFGFVIEVDWTDIPQVWLKGVLQDMTADFDDQEDQLDLKDAAGHLLGFLPVGHLFVGSRQVTLQRRLWQDGGKNYLLVGVRCDRLAGLPDGDLTFDPTVDVQIAASTNDGRRRYSGFSQVTNIPYIGYRDHTDYRDCANYFRWPSVTFEGTITTAYIQIYGSAIASKSNPEMRVYGVDQDNPAAPTTEAEFDADPLTTASVLWATAFTSEAWNTSPELKAIFQELADSYTVSSDAVMLQVKNAKVTTSDNWNRNEHYDEDTTKGAKLHVEYTVSPILADIDHEGGTLAGAGYDSTVEDSGDLTVAAAAALGGTDYGLQCVIDDQNAIYGQVNLSLPSSGLFRVRFYIDTNGLTMADQDSFPVVRLETLADWICQVRLEYESSSYYLTPSVQDDTSSAWEVGKTSVSDGVHYVEFLIEQASTDTSADGAFTVWIDGTQRGTRTTLDNYDYQDAADRLIMGALSGVDTGTSGTLYLDELVIRSDDTEIGPNPTYRAKKRHLGQAIGLGLKIGF